MLRQTTKLSSCFRPMAKIVQARANSSQAESPCEHHKELVPPFQDICKLKNFELKSDCTTFHLKSAGHDPKAQPCLPPCPPEKKKAPCPCPDEPPCDD